MKALSIKQPWIHAILREGKDVENRTWQRSHRGWIALHACARPRRDAEFPRGHRVPDLKTLDYSAICGVVRLVNIVTRSRSKWFDGSPFGWVLTNLIPLKKPIACKGALNLWPVLTCRRRRRIGRACPKTSFSATRRFEEPTPSR